MFTRLPRDNRPFPTCISPCSRWHAVCDTGPCTEAPGRRRKGEAKALFKSPGMPSIKVKTTEGNVFWTHEERKGKCGEGARRRSGRKWRRWNGRKRRRAKRQVDEKKLDLEARELDVELEEMKWKEREEEDAVATGKLRWRHHKSCLGKETKGEPDEQ